MKGVTKAWPGVGAVLRDADLMLPGGALSFIEGANGVGKTTLLRIIAGLVEADVGEVRVSGLRLTEDRRGYQARLGVVAAGNSGLYNRLDCHQHLRFAAGISLVRPNRRDGLIGDVVRAFALEEFANRRVDRISMGQRQRLRLAMGFVHQPSLLLLDEPTTSLDSAGAQILAAALSAHLEAGRAALWFGPTGASPSLAPSQHLRLDHGALVAS